MTWELMLVIGAMTFASRALSVVVLPPLPARVRHVVDRMPAAIFAGLAARELVLPGGGLVDVHTIAAAAGAVIVTPRRSLLVCLIGGLVGYVAGDVALRIM